MQRRLILQSIAALTTLAASPWGVAQTRPQVEVWKDPDCGCCKDWVAHLQANGFDVKVNDSGNAAARTRLRIPEKMGSCHTATVGAYALEGHVPAREIQRLLKEKPKAIGLAVPGMPIGSPGMDGALYRGRVDAYDVLLVLEDGSSRAYKSYPRVSSKPT
ncbi:MAG: DUF411 domain-containing protein [Polaromonas sp.]|uniref:DUF411 domain-containing protein n=1 Tax=Polaromonas sp. TaxID=1869339 RepID=UPI0024892767|nr:DUF411 domain-containing protein [Polaromonas sp.]MDI1237396.1 DUF411 domain-containing protein [Polaromonas sp.]